MPPRVITHWPCAASSISRARHDLRAVMGDWGLSELADAAELVLSELLTNAVRHAAARTREVGTRYERDGTGGVRLEVSDGSPVAPQLRTAGPDAENGRGLGLVDALTGGRWGVVRDPRGGGKTVWARIPG
ncbi:ATP-binding protein [Streptomyces sp. CA-111067]|uniref:ATP-binding protein n=1 Tax=Streptomyces sp. CA-111067 TaxID=3240046 RepID=UPI003D98F9AA